MLCVMVQLFFMQASHTLPDVIDSPGLATYAAAPAAHSAPTEVHLCYHNDTTALDKGNAYRKHCCRVYTAMQGPQEV